MARDLDPATAAAVQASVVPVAAFVEMDFLPEPFRLWSGVGDFRWGDKTFTGAGDLMGISSCEETSDTRSVVTTLTLSAVPTFLIDRAMEAKYRGRSGVVWFVTLDDAEQIVGRPMVAMSGRMDVMTWSEGQTATISLTVESRLADLERARVRRYTDRDQQAVYPGDLGFQFVDSLQETAITWGQG